ncbi:hypothetical protein LXA43DRAFT_459631 [Ganoderma leucocontextum]|nr:hypothetical protein LXA43DRAFT_459631 [Ganoderma leucocontextum]
MSVGGQSQPGTDQPAIAWTVQLQAGNGTHMNDAHPIGSLPPELFVHIFQELLRTDGPAFGTDWTNPYQLVCRAWRDAICSTPSFWQEIWVSRSPEWLQVCLARCAGTLAIVYVLSDHSPSATFATLRCYATSIKACHAHSDRDSLSGLSSLLAAPMPALESLSLRHSPFEAIADVPITHDLLPRLTTLSLANWSAPRETAVYTWLRSLTLVDTTWPFSYDHFLDVMESSHDLEYLDLNLDMLDEHSDVLDTLMAHHSPDRPPVVLPRLQAMKILAPPEVAFHLSASIYAPRATVIEVGSYIHGPDEDPGPLAAHLLAPILHLGYPFLRSPTSVLIRCRNGMLGLRLQSGAGSFLCFLEHRLLMSDMWPTAYLAQNLTAIMDVFSVASVDTLEVEGRPDGAAAETWQRVFEGFPGLRTLHLKGSGTLGTLWLGLERATAASIEQDGVVSCPFLSEVTTDDRPATFKFYASTRLFEAMRRALGARADHCGGRGLQKLKLHLIPAKELCRQTAEFRDALVEDVRALVGELDYHEYPRT